MDFDYRSKKVAKKAISTMTYTGPAARAMNMFRIYCASISEPVQDCLAEIVAAYLVNVGEYTEEEMKEKLK